MKIARAILETLQDMDKSAIDELYDRMLNVGFLPKKLTDMSIMFIFPDGRMLGQEETKGGRQFFHKDILGLLREEYDDKTPDTHIIFNQRFAMHYNLVIVAPMGGSVRMGVIYVPLRTELTNEQFDRIYDLYNNTYGNVYTPYSLYKKHMPWVPRTRAEFKALINEIGWL
jgi:hypothetical protein